MQLKEILTLYSQTAISSPALSTRRAKRIPASRQHKTAFPRQRRRVGELSEASSIIDRSNLFFASVGELGLFGFRTIKESFGPPLEFAEVIRQLFEIGWRSGPLVIVSGFSLRQEVQQTVANAEDTTQQIKGAVSGFLSAGPGNEKPADDLRATVQDAHRATRNLAAETSAIKHNFFLRGFFHRRGFYTLTLNRKEYDASDFVKNSSKRIWLSAENMFTASANGKQQLTEEGRSELENALSEVADNLPNNPIMIEGYAESGSPTQQYLASLQRAEDVKQYLQSRFHLNPDLVGTIALEDKPPQATGLRVWSGVCLSLVISRD